MKSQEEHEARAKEARIEEHVEALRRFKKETA
jgi:hypothetical protein